MFEEFFLENLDRLKFDASVAGCQFFFKTKLQEQISQWRKSLESVKGLVFHHFWFKMTDSTRKEQTTVRFTKAISAV